MNGYVKDAPLFDYLINSIYLRFIYSNDLVMQGFIDKLYVVFIFFICFESAHDSP